jgi:AbrB family looped-hinge helix DNA binding protein
MFGKSFYGSTTIGERGQIVIPIEARKVLNIERGEKLLVFGFHGDSILLSKISSFKKLSVELTKKQKEVEEIIKKS